MPTGRPKQAVRLTEEERERCPGRKSHHPDLGKHATRRNALEHAGFSQSHWTEPDDDQPDLAGLRFATTSYRDVQAVARSATDRESARHRRPVYEPARSRAGL